jgi:hypothetical protein
MENTAGVSTESIIGVSYLKTASTEQERQFIKQLSASAEKGSIVVYALELENSLAGLIGLSASRVDSISTVQIDYLFVAEQCRGVVYEELSSTKISTYFFPISLPAIIPLAHAK